ncbi:chromatin-remodeling histone chaperone [Starmerella bacillaris]|uniref:Chromatin-remodeling histone chaperone n=1 Tax=Starmerella bacillaris TaxID=1247836 RepID=A0AAV5RGJ5_STABA|nr:chromatin-remodeling histone chaperone [Starmerella bacillaris]
MNRRKGVGDSSDDESEGEMNVSATSQAPIDRASSAEPSTSSRTPPRNSNRANSDSEESSEGEGDAMSDDSSEEGSEDDEEEIAKVRDGFIVDSDAESDEDASKSRRRRRRKKRAREAEDIQLDEDDLDVIGVAKPEQTESRFKRLKLAGSEKSKGLSNMFNDEEEEEAPRRAGEFDDFIEADEFSEDEVEALRREEEREIGQRRSVKKPGLSMLGDLANLDEDKLSEIYDVFGDGEMYDWALANEEEGDAVVEEDVQLTDVFEPSELAARMLTAEDNKIRVEDMPERYQILRQRLKHAYDLDPEEYADKKDWIGNKIANQKKVDGDMIVYTKQAVSSVVDFISKENLEVPFIWHHRKDFIFHFSTPDADAVRTQLLSLNDLWEILALDMDYHALIERKKAAQTLAKQISEVNPDSLTVFNQLETHAFSCVEFQDIIEYLQFQFSSVLKTQKRHMRFGLYERIRQSSSMEIVEAIGCKADDIAKILLSDSNDSVLQQDTPALSPTEVAEATSGNLVDAELYVGAALSVHPLIRKFFRQQFEAAKVDIIVTDDGKKKITSNSPFADLKYSCNWTLQELRDQPALYLRMLRAEEQGLLIVRAQYPHYKTTLYSRFARVLGASISEQSSSDNPWSDLRGRVAKNVSRTLVPIVARNVLESLRADCVRSLRSRVREAFKQRLDQAPYKPAGYVLGTVARVMCISAGEGASNDAVLATVVDEDGHVAESVKLGDLRNSNFGEKLIDAVKSSRPDVVGIAGFTSTTFRLYEEVRKYIVEQSQLKAGPEDAEAPLQVVWVNDEVARLFRNSKRAVEEFPDLVPNARYCVAGARYLQGPLYEYAQLDEAQLRSLPLHPDQYLLSNEDFNWATETAYVDFVCLDGVDINLAVRQPYKAAVLPYVAGLGPRKAQGMIQAILSRVGGGRLVNRTQLVTSEITTSTVFMNCASFFKIPWSSSPEDDADFLDSTRTHPEDYELARKMCADALELDEEDVIAFEGSHSGGVVVKLLNEDSEGRKLDELILEEYAKELSRTFKQQKRITLEQIRSEIQDAYAEKRDRLHVLTSDEVFTMLTGETKSSFQIGSVVSGTVRRVTGRQLVMNLSGGIHGVAESGNISDDRSVPINQQFAPGQAVQAVLISVDYGRLFAIASTSASAVKQALKMLEQKEIMSIDKQHWNFEAQDRDSQSAQRKAEQQQRQMRVIKHPLFRSFSAKEAEDYLAPLQRGDLVIRPSSRGTDHLVVTWKVSEQIYQHIDVKELDKPNEYALGRTLQVGPYKYTDLDELILMHVQSMSRKIDEITASDKFQKGNRKDVERWLKAYTNARPTQSVYAFCFDHRRPGYLLLCYMLGANEPIKELHVRVLPNAYELLGHAYPDVLGLTNGFKMMVQRSRV